ncbi:hypothetical protein [Evansella cellulosilytica]|uniref:Uncharacterized protein n=1 Tax=Evansella cellulosilytica (strain ATCC 21833 / DSM 2522 / FERM P-1141 / JCM 9156 / N-4) TaxID=649639 RepID=E6TVP5_EVAC2|nr:hypothetical protein [Evansella cellulosilytica]ADU32173.1 hypothetical protein Bcell_3938 [Evansella cellulosilytica DSM 2522]
MIRLFYSIGIIFIVFGLFNNWVVIEWKHARGIEHWTGVIILLLTIIATYFLIKVNHRYLMMIGVGVIILAGVQFFMFASILNISSASLSFSMASVTVGFYLTLFGASIICIFGTLNSRIIKSA